jgi:hypothetical protein
MIKRRVSVLWGIACCLLFFLTGCRDSRARVIIDNQSECGAIQVRLSNTTSSEVLETKVASGATYEFVVQPDVYYEYIIDFTAAGATKDDYRCTSLEQGKVRVPAGTAQTFTLRSEKQTAVPTP